MTHERIRDFLYISSGKIMGKKTSRKDIIGIICIHIILIKQKKPPHIVEYILSLSSSNNINIPAALFTKVPGIFFSFGRLL